MCPTKASESSPTPNPRVSSMASGRWRASTQAPKRAQTKTSLQGISAHNPKLTSHRHQALHLQTTPRFQSAGKHPALSLKLPLLAEKKPSGTSLKCPHTRLLVSPARGPAEPAGPRSRAREPALSTRGPAKWRARGPVHTCRAERAFSLRGKIFTRGSHPMLLRLLVTPHFSQLGPRRIGSRGVIKDGRGVIKSKYA